MVEKIVVSGPVIISSGKLLVIKDDKDDFYKIPGGTVKEGESLEETCLREFFEETGLKCKILKKLSAMNLEKNPNTGKKMKIELNHYFCEMDKISNYNSFYYNNHFVTWIKLDELSKYRIAPNIKYLIDKGDIK